jgi:hypothetical protein
VQQRKDDLDRVYELASQAWRLTDDELESIQPGSADGLAALLRSDVPGDNPLATPDVFSPDPAKGLLSVMRRPEFFTFTCKNILSLGAEKPLLLLPFQQVVLQELWWRMFPLLVATRGGGKSMLMGVLIALRLLFSQGTRIVVTGAGLRQSKIIFEYVERIWHSSPVYRDLAGYGRTGERCGPKRGLDRHEFIVGDSVATFIPTGDGTTIRGLRANIILSDEFQCVDASTIIETDRGLMRIGDCRRELGNFALTQADGTAILPSTFVETPPTKAYRVRTTGNYEFICSSIHRVMTTDGWKLAKDLTDDDCLVQFNAYQFPEEMVVDEESGVVVDEDVAWLMGALVSEGCVSADAFTVHTTDRLFVSKCAELLEKLSPDRSITIYDRDAYDDDRGWKCKEAFTIHLHHKRLRAAFERLGIPKTTAHGKSIPWSILRSPKGV